MKKSIYEVVVIYCDGEVRPVYGYPFMTRVRAEKTATELNRLEDFLHGKREVKYSIRKYLGIGHMTTHVSINDYARWNG